MQSKLMFLSMASVLMLGASCSSHYVLTGIHRSRILVDDRYDASPDAKAVAFIKPYQHQVDSIMSPVVGTISKYVAAHQPESEISNLLADILIWGGREFNEHPVVSVYNMGGIRAPFAKGNVTYGDVVEVAPFENKICFLTLNGSELMELFGQIAKRGGEDVNHGVNLVINKYGKLLDAKVNGVEVDPAKDYRIATIDYLAQGNDGLSALKKGRNLLSPQEKKNDTRFIIMDYFREQMAKGITVDPQIEGRIVVK